LRTTFGTRNRTNGRQFLAMARERWQRTSILFTLAALAVLMSTILSGRTWVNADDPRDKAGADLPLGSSTRQAICITASDHGPYFTLADLKTYAPPPPKPRAWKIVPPVWKEYPVELAGIPIASRSYTSETVSYMAEHEIRHGDRELPHVALTFDCEAGTRSTLHILKTLEEEDVKATFFVLGKYAYQHPEIVRQIAAGGHVIGNHSFFHPLFTALTPITATLEITYTEAAIDWAVGQHVPMRYLRFPYGGRNKTTRLHAASLGYQSAFWDIDPRGWDPENSAEDVVEHVRKTAHCGGIVIMHCGSWDDANALGQVIQAIREKGLLLGTLSDVLSEADRDVPGYTPP